MGHFRSAQINQYVFCANNPVNFRDPFGLCSDAGEISAGSWWDWHIGSRIRAIQRFPGDMSRAFYRDVTPYRWFVDAMNWVDTVGGTFQHDPNLVIGYPPAIVPGGGGLRVVNPRTLVSGSQRTLDAVRFRVQAELVRGGIRRATPITIYENGVILDGHHGAAAAAAMGRYVEVRVLGGSGQSATGLAVTELPFR